MQSSHYTHDQITQTKRKTLKNIKRVGWNPQPYDYLLHNGVGLKGLHQYRKRKIILNQGKEKKSLL